MQMREIVKDFFTKVIAPVVALWLLYTIFYSVFAKDGVIDYLHMWVFCGFPFGVMRMHGWLIPNGRGSVSVSVAIWVLNFFIGGLIGGFVLAWKLLRAAWYFLLTPYRLFTLIGSNRRGEIYGEVEVSKEP